jgi:glycosyltransferase involved in cell wall biosynthesis
VESAPTISVIMPVYRPDVVLLERAVASVRAQIHSAWQLCVCNDGSRDVRLSAYLERIRADPRCRVVVHETNRGISAAQNTALAEADGAFACFLDQDDELHPEALAEIALATVRDPAIDLVYTDEDKLDEAGLRSEPFFKPDWSPDTLLSHMYVGHLIAIRRTLLDRLGGFRPAFDGSQDYDLVLRAPFNTCRRFSTTGGRSPARPRSVMRQSLGRTARRAQHCGARSTAVARRARSPTGRSNPRSGCDGGFAAICASR